MCRKNFFLSKILFYSFQIIFLNCCLKRVHLMSSANFQEVIFKDSSFCCCYCRFMSYYSLECSISIHSEGHTYVLMEAHYFYFFSLHSLYTTLHVHTKHCLNLIFLLIRIYYSSLLLLLLHSMPRYCCK